MANSPGLTIGRLAKQAGVNVETIRYYQRLGILETPPKPAYGTRTYAPEMVRKLRFIKRAQAMGFTLREIGELLDLDGTSCESVQKMAQSKLATIEEKIRSLQDMRQILEQTLQVCRSGDQPGCFLLEKLLEMREDT